MWPSKGRRTNGQLGTLAEGESGLAPGSVQVKGLFTNEHDKGSNLLEVPDWNENHHGAGKGAEQDLYTFSDVALVRLGITVLGYDDKYNLGSILARVSFKSFEHFAKVPQFRHTIDNASYSNLGLGKGRSILLNHFHPRSRQTNTHISSSSSSLGQSRPTAGKA